MNKHSWPFPAIAMHSKVRTLSPGLSRPHSAIPKELAQVEVAFSIYFAPVMLSPEETFHKDALLQVLLS
jgi:hypothetical protein